MVQNRLILQTASISDRRINKYMSAGPGGMLAVLVSNTNIDGKEREKKVKVHVSSRGCAGAGLMLSYGDRFPSYHLALLQSGVRWVI